MFRLSLPAQRSAFDSFGYLSMTITMIISTMMPTKTSAVLKIPADMRMKKPTPSVAATNSPTMAPITAKGILVRMPVKT